MRKVERSDQLTPPLSGTLFLVPTVPILTSTSDLAIPPLPVFPPPLPRRLWEQAGWSLGICEQDGHEEPLGFGSPGAAHAGGGREGRQRGQRNSMLEERAQVWVVVCWIVFFNLSFFFKEKPPSCVIIYGICNSGKICTFNLAVHIKTHCIIMNRCHGI